MHKITTSMAGLMLILNLILTGCAGGQSLEPTGTPIPPPTAIPSATSLPSATSTTTPIPPTASPAPPTPIPLDRKQVTLIYVESSKPIPSLEVWLGYYDEVRSIWIPQQGVTDKLGTVTFEVPQGKQGESYTFVFTNSEESLALSVKKVSLGAITGFRIPPDPAQKSLTLKIYGKNDVSVETGSVQMWVPKEVGDEIAQGTPGIPDLDLPLLETSLETAFILDTFDDNANQWPEGDFEMPSWKGSRAISGGVLEWQGVSREGMFSTANPGNPALREGLMDQRVSVRVKCLTPQMEGAFGVTLRAKQSDGAPAFYAFLVSPDDNYGFFLFNKGAWTPIIDWQEVDQVAWSEWNKIAVEARGGHFKLFLNDNLVNEADDGTLPIGKNELFLETFQSSVKFKVQFDDFQVDKLKS